MRTLAKIALFAAAGLAAVTAHASELQRDLLVGDGGPGDAAPVTVTEKDFIATAEKYLIGIVAMVAVAVFVWIGYNLLTAEGDPEQFKKAQKALIYAVVGLAVIPLAYAMVRLVLTVNL